MISQTEQSILRYDADTVLKTYKKDHILFNEKYFESEIEALSILNGSKHFIDAYEVGDCSYRMKRYDFSLGTADKLNYIAVSRVLFSLGIDEILKNLDLILRELRKSKIAHRDINPGNLLYSQKERLLKLTDFFWCSNNGKTPLPEQSTNHPWPVNGKYGTDDSKAIDKIKAEIKFFYESYFMPKCEIITNDFITTVGCGNYKDGSSVFEGFAYHVVDIPQFKESIKYHKNTCINEYQTIKDNMPIEPKSLIDIGMACGYFTFNLLRDFNINNCIGFEADVGVNRFLCEVNNLYSQSIDIWGKFDHTISFKEKDEYDIAIFLNSHMWLYKQLGREKTLECVKNILNHCRYMFFQTCGAYSSGMYKVMEYKSYVDIRQMLYDAGAKKVANIGEFVGSHDAPRHMFLVRGQVE